MKIRQEVNNKIIMHYNDLVLQSFTINDEMIKNRFPYLNVWFSDSVAEIKNLTQYFTNEPNNDFMSNKGKYKLTIAAMQYIEWLHKKHCQTSKALYDVGIDIINFDMFENAISVILNEAYDKVTVDYIQAYLYDFDCCKTQELKIEWIENGSECSYVINDVTTLVGYVQKFICEVM